ncbi:thiamine diphosphate-binding fold protein [Raphanus sativus]|nr:thiamine diphosphate-binding fold protein [Raphanus sativus]
MNDEGMDHVVFALARKKAAKGMLKEMRDLQRFGGMVGAPGGRKWVAKELAVVSESKDVTGDMITDVVLDQVDGMDAFTVKQACKFAKEYALKNGPIVRNDEPEKLKEDHCLRTEQGDCNQKATTSLCRNNQACNDDTFVSPSGNCRGGSNLIPVATEAQAAAPGLLIKWQT